MRTEISAKFTRARVEDDLSAAGLEIVSWLTDPDELFAHPRARREAPPTPSDRGNEQQIQTRTTGSDVHGRPPDLRPGRLLAMRIEGSAALVVGGVGTGRGHGATPARGGAIVTIADVNAEKGERARLRAGRSSSSRATCARRVRCRWRWSAPPGADGGLRIAVCCAGIGWAQKVAGSRGPHALIPFETTIQINLIGTFNVLRLAATAMIATEPLEDGRTGRVHQHRLDRRLRRPDRPDRLLGLEGRHRRHDPARRARPRRPGHSREHDRPGPVRHAAARRRSRRRPARSWAQACPSPSASAPPPSTPSSPVTSWRTGCSTARSSASTAPCACPPAERLSRGVPGSPRVALSAPSSRPVLRVSCSSPPPLRTSVPPASPCPCPRRRTLTRSHRYRRASRGC